MYPQGACRIRKAAKPPTAAQYFKIFKPISWGERPAERRSRFIQRFLNYYIGEISANQRSLSAECNRSVRFGLQQKRLRARAERCSEIPELVRNGLSVHHMPRPGIAAEADAAAVRGDKADGLCPRCAAVMAELDLGNL